MKRLLAAAAVLSAFAMVAPAHAEPQRYDAGRYDNQRYDNGRGYEQNYDQRGPGDFRRHDDRRFSRDDIARLERRIEWGSRSGALNRYESRRLWASLNDLKDRSRYYWRTDGISWRERQDLEARYDRLSFEVRRQIRDDDYRGGYRR